MKKFIHIVMTFAAGALLLASCEKEKQEPKARPAGELEVSILRDGTPVSVLSLNSLTHVMSLDVKTNNPYVWWKVTSDSDWCQVKEGTQRGDGKISLVISANESFDDREPATLTFTAGEYTGPSVRVDQSGNVFLMSRNYAMCGAAASEVTDTVTVPEGTAWDFAPSDWIQAVRGTSTTTSGMTSTLVTFQVAANAGEARYGSIGLVRAGQDEAEAAYNVWQSDASASYTGDGRLLLDAEGVTDYEFRAPSQMISSLVCPEYVSWTMRENADGTDSFLLSVMPNPSDAGLSREIDIVARTRTAAGSMDIKLFSQDFYWVDGVISAAGLQCLARAFNAGEDISHWQKDGEVVLLNNIDMSAVTDWEPIGTQTRPFDGKFNGAYRKISGWNTGKPFFGVCEGASLRNVVIDDLSSLTISDMYASPLCVALLCGEARSTEFTECTNSAPLTISGSAAASGALSYVGGLVGKADADCSFSSCLNSGAITLTSDISNPSSALLYAGGIVGYCEGSVASCSNEGTIRDDSNQYRHDLGGIAGYASGALSGCSNTGAISASGERVVSGVSDYNRWILIGGIVGAGAGESVTGCRNDAPLSTSSTAKSNYLGGIIGNCSAVRPTLSDNHNGTAGDITFTGASRYSFAGGLYGRFEEEVQLDFSATKSTSRGRITLRAMENSSNSSVCLGGLVGRAEALIELVSPSFEDTLAIENKSLATSMGELAVGGILGGSSVLMETQFGSARIQDATMKGAILVNCSSSYGFGATIAGVGGIVGQLATGLTASGCHNEGEILFAVKNAKTNGKSFFVGGIAGRVLGGTSSLTDCSNTARLDNEHYNNNVWTTAQYTCNATAGILGGYGFRTAENVGAEDVITISGCTNTGAILSLRGIAAGIAGYLRAATVRDCWSTGTMGHGERSYIGGVAGIVESSTLSNCWMKGYLAGQSAGSEIFSGGGVVGILMTDSVLDGCRWNGTILSNTTTAGEAIGGIAGVTSAGCQVKNCAYGGTVAGTAVNESNVADKAIGDSGITPENLTFWNGN